MLQTHYFVSAVILSLIFFTPTLNAQNISMSDMAADHPACLEHDVELGCLLADFPNALVSRVEGEALESMKQQDLADTIDLAKEVSDGLDAAKFLALDLPRYGATAAVKMKALATLKALPATLTWEGFKRNTARVDLLLLSEAEMQDAANELGEILGAESAALPQLLEADRYWATIMLYSPQGSSFVRWLTGSDGERDFPISLAAPDATPTQAQSSQNSSWIAPTLNYPEHWLTEELVELRAEPDTLYLITPKDPLDVAGMMNARLSVAVEGATRGVKNAYAEYDPEAEPVDLLVEAALAGRSAIESNEERSNPPANTGPGISRTSDLVEITGSADSTFLSEVVEAQLGAPVNVVDWREIAEKFEEDGPDFLQPFANEDGKVSGLGVTLDGDPSYSSNRFYFVAVGPVHSNFLSHEIARFGNETLHLGSWYGPYRYLYRTAVDDSREEVEGALGEANAIDDVEQESSQVDWSNATPIKVFESSEIITVSDFSPAGNAFAVATVEGSWADDHSRAGIAYILDAKSRKKLISITGHTDRIIDLAFSNSGSYLITTSEDKTARVWDASTGREKHRLEHKSWVRSAAFSPDDKRVVTVSDGTITIWEISTGRIVEQFPGGESVENAAYSPNGRFIVTSSNDLNTQYAQIWDAYTVEKIVSITGHDDKILYANFSPSGKTVVTTSRDASARIWNARNGNQLGVLSGHENAVIHASFSSDGRFVATSSSDMTARIWDTETGKEVAILEGHGLNSDYIRPVSSVTFAPGRHAVLTSSEDGTALIWSSESE